MSFEVTGVIKIVDEASEAVAEATANIQSSLGRVEEANAKVSSSTRQADMSARQLITGFSGVATSAFALYNAYDRVQDMQVSVDRANLQVKTSLNAVEDAQRRYNSAVEKYGEGSEQAAAAAKDLQLAQERYQVAVERAQMVQGNLNEAMVQSALTVIPSLITMVDSGAKAFSGFHGAVNLVNKATAFLAANPLMAVVTAIGLVVGALVTAYQTCEPFRNAVNAIGEALYNFFKPAIDAVTGALSWLWNNIVAPFIGTLKQLWDVITNNPVLAALFGPITTIAYLVKHWDEVSQALTGTLTWVWRNVLEPLGRFIAGFFKAQFDAAAATLNWLNRNVVKPLGDALTWLWRSVIEPLANFVKGTFKPIMDAVGGVVNAVGGAVNTLGNALKGLCFRHAAPAAEAFNTQLEQGIQLTNALAGDVEELAGSLKGVAGAASPTVRVPHVNAEAAAAQAPASQTLVLSPTINVTVPEGSSAVQDPRSFAESVYAELSAIVRRDLRAQTFFVAR